MKKKRFQKQALKTFFIKHNIDAKIEVTQLSRAEGMRYYTRLGVKYDNYHTNVHDQWAAKDYLWPRLNGINKFRSKFRVDVRK